MIVINIGGGPGSGKTTLAYYLTYRLKIAGYRAEFVGEAAREHIYESAPGVVPPQLLDDQPLLAGEQYERVKRLERQGFQVAVSDSPVMQGVLYCTNEQHIAVLEPLARLLQHESRSINIFARRNPGTFDAESRVQKNEEEAAAFDQKVYSLMDWDWEYRWGHEEGVATFVLLSLLSMGIRPHVQELAEDKS